MMPLRIDRVVQCGAQEDVCSVIVDDRGMYVICMASIDALMNETFSSNGASASAPQPFRETLATTERRVRRATLSLVDDSLKTFYVPREDITMVYQTGSSSMPRLTIFTRQKVYNFLFPQARVEDVIALKRTITRGELR